MKVRIDKVRSEVICGMQQEGFVGDEARRQLDFFIKRRTDAVDTSHDWKDVRVIGEHRVSQKDWKNKFLQIARYVRDVFSVQPARAKVLHTWWGRPSFNSSYPPIFKASQSVQLRRLVAVDMFQ